MRPKQAIMSISPDEENVSLLLREPLIDPEAQLITGIPVLATNAEVDQVLINERNKEDKDNDHLFGIVLNVMYTAFCVWGLSEILVCQWNSRYDGLDLGENNKNPLIRLFKE